jgi:hypothetical protein
VSLVTFSQRYLPRPEQLAQPFSHVLGHSSYCLLLYPLSTSTTYEFRVAMTNYVEITSDGGTGQKLTYATTVVAGFASVIAIIFSVMYALFTSLMMMRITNPSSQLNSVTSQKLSQASSTTICRQNPCHGSHILDRIMD